MNRRILVSGLKPALYTVVFFALCALHAKSMEAGPGSKLAMSPSAKTPTAQPLQITSQAEGENSVKIQIKIASSVQSPSLNVHLNGNEISSRFSRTECGNAVCETATVLAADGLRQEKNVLTVIAAPGISSRYRFDANVAPTASSLQKRSDSARASHNSIKLGLSNQTASAGVLEPFLPPTISFKTNNPGGWDPGNPWFTIGTQSYPTNTSPSGCSGTAYMAVVLDRQTLTEKTSAPESSPQCFSDEANLKTYLEGMNSSDLVVVGSNFFTSPKAGLDLSAIGGSVWPGSPGDGGYPAGIMAVGVGGTAANSAYQSFYVQKSGYESINAFANGTLQEDAYGNYNFQSSDVVEFTVSPNADASGLTGTSSSTIVVQLPKSVQAASDGGIINAIYTPPAGTNGYWLLVLSRNTLYTPVACPSKSADIHHLLVSNCGSFYATGSSDAATSMQAYKQLATDLSNVNNFQMAILTTIGQAAYGGSSNSIWEVAGFNQTYSGPSNGFTEFSAALAALGGQAGLTQSLLSPTSAYTYISSPGIGGPLNGNSIESTTSLPTQGQSGLVHGIMQRNLNGLFMPEQTTQESMIDFQNKNGLNSSEFRLTEAALQQPVDWPSSSSTTLLPGAATLGGQVDAYRYLSYVLLANVYTPGLTGAHLDDIHYFFTGSLNTSINYHYYEPYNIVWPGANTFGPYVLPCNSVDNSNPQNPVCTVAIV